MAPSHGAAKLIDIPKLTDWLDDNIPDLGDGLLDAKMVHGGTSNVIFSLNRGKHSLMLRRPPAVPPPGSESTVLREARVLRALSGTRVPHPKCFGSCSDPEVIGAPFYVMELVQGWAGELRDDKIHYRPPFEKMPYAYGVPFAVVDGLIQLANVDYKAIGLEDFGKPDNYLARQVDRWAKQLSSYKRLYNYSGRELPGYELTERWLRANTPKSSKAGIIHGDIGTTNMLFSPDPPARLTAFIDWELSTIGDPLIDLAWFCNGLRDERAPDEILEGSLSDPTDWPTRQELARYYAAGTGRDISNFDYYLLLARFKVGCILEYKVAQSAAGVLSKETGAFFSRIVLKNFENAAAMIRMIG
jgi:aminoglycoside phosphotransferase (APT) family kinase protein